MTRLTLIDLKKVFLDVIHKKMSFEEASAWATQMLEQDELEQLELQDGEDISTIFVGLTYLSGVDIEESPGDYLHSIDNVKDKFYNLFGHSYSVIFPTRTEVISKLEMLISGECSRKEASDWALRWTRTEQVPQDIEDEVWKVLKHLSMANITSVNKPYLYQKEDFETWLTKLKQKTE